MKLSLKIKLAFLLALSAVSLFGFFYTYSLYNPRSVLSFIGDKPEENALFKKLTYISGEVKSPGVYEFEEGMRIIDIINLAGGISEKADAEYISSNLNISELVKDELKIFIPASKSNEVVLGSSTSSSSEKLININSANLSELDTLPGIGESTAEKIIENRPYETIEDLLNVSGIGESKFEVIKDLISVN